MELPDWAAGFPGAITVCDTRGVIVYMNDRSATGYASEGGRALLGTNMLDCHPEPARSKVRELLNSQRTNAYTIEKRGIHKVIYQAPWYADGAFAGLVELSLEVPAEMPHFVRQP
jgi:transcriptional regulator with PAS, ATPase and Fis domain